MIALPSMKKFLIAAAMLCIALASLRADVTIKFSGDSLLDNHGQPLANGSLVILLADVGTSSTSPTSFETLVPGTLGIGDYLNGGRYQVLGRTYVDELSFEGQFAGIADSLSLGSGNFPHLNTGDQLAVAWFPTLIGSEHFGVPDYELLVGYSYGLYTLANDPFWQVPADGTILADNYAIVPGGTAASYTVSAIPEPSTYAALLGLAVLGFAVHRRHHR